MVDLRSRFGLVTWTLAPASGSWRGRGAAGYHDGERGVAAPLVRVIDLMAAADHEFRSACLADAMRNSQQATPQSKHAIVRQCEQLHDEQMRQGELSRLLPLDFVLFRVLRYNVSPAAGLYGQVRAEDLLADLRHMIDRLSHAAPLPAGEEEPAASVHEVAAELGVSTKTISRWRKLGLRWRWVQPETGRPRLGFPPEAVHVFAEAFPQKVEQAAKFSQIPAEARRELIEQARAMAASEPGISPFHVAQRLAEQTGRGRETLRQMLLHHNRLHPLDPIFPDHRPPLDEAAIREIHRAYREGSSPSVLARRYGCSRSSVHRAVLRQRLRLLWRVPLSYHVLPTFVRSDADEVLLPPGPGETAFREAEESGHNAAGGSTRNGLPPPLDELFGGPRLTEELEQSVLVRMNYLKYRVDQARHALRSCPEPKASELEQIEQWIRRAGELRRLAVRIGLQHLLSVAQRHAHAERGEDQVALLNLLVLGVPTVVQAVGQFDPGQSPVFARYVDYQLMRRFAVDDTPASNGHDGRARRRETAESAHQRVIQQLIDHGIRQPDVEAQSTA